MNKERIIKIMDMVSKDVKDDADNFESKPFTGKVVGEYFGHHGAAIKAVAKAVKEILLNLPDKGD